MSSWRRAARGRICEDNDSRARYDRNIKGTRRSRDNVYVLYGR
jgi:hypothetical protein